MRLQLCKLQTMCIGCVLILFKEIFMNIFQFFSNFFYSNVSNDMKWWNDEFELEIGRYTWFIWQFYNMRWTFNKIITIEWQQFTVIEQFDYITQSITHIFGSLKRQGRTLYNLKHKMLILFLNWIEFQMERTFRSFTANQKSIVFHYTTNRNLSRISPSPSPLP